MSKFEELAEAKRAVSWLLDHESGSVNFHGIAYWAGRVETLREETVLVTRWRKRRDRLPAGAGRLALHPVSHGSGGVLPGDALRRTERPL